MCIRDSLIIKGDVDGSIEAMADSLQKLSIERIQVNILHQACLLYTSDAADERSSVDLGGRRIIKKKTSDNTEAGRSIVYNGINHVYLQTSEHKCKQEKYIDNRRI